MRFFSTRLKSFASLPKAHYLNLIVPYKQIQLSPQVSVFAEKLSQEEVVRLYNAENKLFGIAFQNPIYDASRDKPDMKWFIDYLTPFGEFEHWSIDDLKDLLKQSANDIWKSYHVKKDQVRLALKLKRYKSTYTREGRAPMTRSDLAKVLVSELDKLLFPAKAARISLHEDAQQRQISVPNSAPAPEQIITHEPAKQTRKSPKSRHLVESQKNNDGSTASKSTEVVVS
jgi:hypothetical protein